jgi:septum formation protein
MMCLTTGLSVAEVDTTQVEIHPIPSEITEALIQEGKIFYCAGGLMVEHPFVQPYIKSLQGGMDSVMGLSKQLTLQLMLRAAGYDETW